MPKYINADEMLSDESEAYMRAQTKVTDDATYLVNHVVHMKLQKLLYDAPAADVREVRRGKWENSKSGLDFIRCSECHAVNDRITKYCPYCGAELDGERNR